MNVKKLLLATLVVGIVAIIWDYVVHMQILMGTYSQMAIFNKDISMLWVIIGDFVWALVFVWVYNRVYGSFSGGPKGGATYGFYAGVLLSFPAMLFNNVLYVDYPYWLAWVQVILGIVYCVIVGAVAGAIYKKEAAPAAA
jgi:hypothetical protein